MDNVIVPCSMDSESEKTTRLSLLKDAINKIASAISAVHETDPKTHQFPSADLLQSALLQHRRRIDHLIKVQHELITISEAVQAITFPVWSISETHGKFVIKSKFRPSGDIWIRFGTDKNELEIYVTRLHAYDDANMLCAALNARDCRISA